MTLLSALRHGATIIGFGALFLGSLGGLPFPAIFATGALALTVLMLTGPRPLSAG